MPPGDGRLPASSETCDTGGVRLSKTILSGARDDCDDVKLRLRTGEHCPGRKEWNSTMQMISLAFA
jgi:hypothetical protein